MRCSALSILCLLCLPACDEPVVAGDVATLDVAQDVLLDEGAPDTEPDLIVVPNPPSLYLTINAIPEVMNGSQPFVAEGSPDSLDYHYQVPEHGFTLDILPRGRNRFDLDGSTLVLSCGALSLAEHCDATQGGSGFSCLISEAAALPIGETVCTAEVQDVYGQSSGELTYAMEVAVMTPELHPFDALDVWLIAVSRDHWTVGLPELQSDGTYRIPHSQVADGQPDYLQDLTAVGLISGDNAASDFVRARFEDRMLELLWAMYEQAPDRTRGPDSVLIDIHLEGRPGAPNVGAPGVSVMGMGGFDPSDPVDPLNGRALLDWNNQGTEDNNTVDLGIFTTAIFGRVLEVNLGVDALAPILPGVGAPIGTHPADATLWSDSFDRKSSTDEEANARYDRVTSIIDFGALALASVIAHEIGHSIGLVPRGLPPGGLFAAVGKASFMSTEASSAHIDVPGLNVMQEGNALELVEVITGALPSFTEVNLAYLRGRIIVP